MKPASRNRAHVTAALVAGLFAANEQAFGQTFPFPPVQSAICTPTYVDKDKLAAYLLKKYPVSLLAWEEGGGAAPGSSSRQVLATLLAEEKICEKKCAPSDQEYLNHVHSLMIDLLGGRLGASFRPTERVGPSRYFSGPNEEYAIRCVVDNQGQPVEAPGATFIPPPKSTSFFRVRGNPAQLYIDRSAKQEFAATDKALVSVADNHATLATTTKLVGYLGYLWSMKEPAPQHGNRVELVPYIGVNRSVVEVREGSAVKPSASSNASAGVLGSFFVTTGDSASSVFGHLINVRPDFLGDHRDGSRILSLNLEYVPVKNGVVNSFVELSKDVASGKLIFSVKTNTGAYTDRGIDSVRESHRNFVRAGGQAGIALTSDNIRMPLDFSAAFTSLGAVAGGTSIDYFKSSLTYSFEANKYFGLSLVYSHGRREDTAKKEDQWEIGLSGRF